MGVEGSGRGVVHTDAGGYADGSTCILGPLRYAIDDRLAIGEHTEGMVLRLLARGQCGASSGTIGHAVRTRVGRNQCRLGEGGEEEGRGADAAFEGGHIGFRTVDLVDSHAVADEIEHILGASSGEGGEGDEEKGRCEQDSFHKICLAAALRPGFKIQRKPAASWFQRSLRLLARWSWRLFEGFGGYERILEDDMRGY